MIKQNKLSESGAELKEQMAESAKLDANIKEQLKKVGWEIEL